MAERSGKAEQAGVIASVAAVDPSREDRPVSSLSSKQAPLVFIQAHEHARHIDLGWRSWVTLALTAVAIAAQVFAITAPSSITAFIVRDMGNQPLSGWILQGPLLMQSILSPSMGRLSDILDRRYMVGIPPLFSMVGAIISARADSMNMLIGGGILIGITLPSAAIVHAIQAEILPLKYRTIGSGVAFFGSAVGGYFGGLAAGAVTNTGPSGWRNVFWIQAGVHALTSLGFLTLYWPIRRSDYPSMSLKQYFWMCDPVGSLLYITGTTCILLSLNWAGGAYAWNDAHVLGPLCFGIFQFVLFGLYQWKGRDDGLVPHVFFESGPNFPVSVLSMCIEGWILYSGITVIVPQTILNLGFEDNSWNIAIRKLAYGTAALLFSMVISFWSTYFKDLKRPLYVAYVVMIISTICFATLTPNQSKLQIFYSVLSGISQAGPLSLLVPIIQFASPHLYLSTASGIAYSGRSIGGAFGSAVLNAISNNYIKQHYASDVAAAAIAAGLPASSGQKLITALRSKTPIISAKEVPGITAAALNAATDRSHWVYARAYQLAWWSILPFVVLAIVCLYFIRDVKELMTEKIEATVEHVVDESEEEKV